MIPSKKTLSNLKAETYINAVRLFIDACNLYINRSYASAAALAILSLEEIGKLEMVDHICDDISINKDSDAQDFIDHLFSRPMFFNHSNKQIWASDPIFNVKNKRIKDISSGELDRIKQNAFYVGYSNRRVRSPRKITRTKAYDEIKIVFEKFLTVGDSGFNGYYCHSDTKSRARSRRWLKKVKNAYVNMNQPKKT